MAIAEPGPTGAVEVPDELPGGITFSGIALSAVLHLALGGLLIVGLPRLFDPPPVEEMPVAVQLVTIAPETRATHPNSSTPRPDAKPEPEIETPVAKPQPKPEPPTPVPVPPSAATIPPMPEPPRPVDTPTPPPVPKALPEPKPEPPKPVEKIEPPKPKEKPEPPRQIAKNEVKPADRKPEDKKYDPGQFAALLKNLAPQQSAPSPDAPPKPHTASVRASSQPKAPLAGQLTASELDLIRHQIARCWNVPAGARDARDLVVEIKVVVDRDGTVQQATIVDQGRMGSDASFRAAAESARRAFFNPQCRPLHLPAEKYAIWKDLVVDFSPKDIL